MGQLHRFRNKKTAFKVAYPLRSKLKSPKPMTMHPTTMRPTERMMGFAGVCPVIDAYMDKKGSIQIKLIILQIICVWTWTWLMLKHGKIQHADEPIHVYLSRWVVIIQKVLLVPCKSAHTLMTRTNIGVRRFNALHCTQAQLLALIGRIALKVHWIRANLGICWATLVMGDSALTGLRAQKVFRKTYE